MFSVRGTLFGKFIAFTQVSCTNAFFKKAAYRAMADSAGIGDQRHAASFFAYFASSDRYRICSMDGWSSPSVFSFSIIFLLPDMYIQLPAIPFHGFLVFSGKCHKSGSLYDRVVMPEKILKYAW